MNKYIKYIKIGLLLSSLSSLLVILSPSWFYKESWFLARALLVVVMFIRPVKDIFPKCKLFIYLLKFRRELWILVWVFWLAHAVWYVIMMSYSNLLWFFTDSFTWDYTGLLFWWMLALLVSIPLLLTSNSFSTKLLWKNWKLLQRLSYFMFVFVAIHIYMIRWEIWPVFVVIVWFIIFNIAYFKNKKNSRKGVLNWPKWLCIPCWYIYDQNSWDPDSWIAPWTRFEDIPSDWLCPVCWVWKSDFVLLDSDIELNEWEVISLNYLTDDVIELVLISKNDFEYVNWQFVSFVMKDDKWEFNRSYSIALKDKKLITFLIKIKQDWRAGILFKKMKVWENVKFTSVSWIFLLQNTKNKKVFIASWTWLAPIYSMLLSLSDDIEKELYFWVAYIKDLFYLDKLSLIKNLKVNIYLSRENVEWYNFGRINFEDISFDENTEVYICWNPWILDSAMQYFQSKNIISNVFYEKF